MTAPSRTRGFTLIELMVILVILGTILLLVPMNLWAFGARSRLQHAANTLQSAVSMAQTQAILDGYPVRLEVGRYRNPGREAQDAMRFVFTNVPTRKSTLLDQEGQPRAAGDDQPPDEIEYLETLWRDLPSGVRIVGVSEEAGRWEDLREGQPYGVAFLADGSVEKGFAIRLETTDLDVKREDRSFTVLVNALTVQAWVEEGYAELPPRLDAHEFGR